MPAPTLFRSGQGRSSQAFARDLSLLKASPDYLDHARLLFLGHVDVAWQAQAAVEDVCADIGRAALYVGVGAGPAVVM